MGWHMEAGAGEKLVRVSHNPRLISTHPQIAAQWHPSLNGQRTPAEVTPTSTYHAWWICEKGHEWSRQVNRRTYHNSNCPDCDLEPESLAVRFPEIANQLSTKNGNIDPLKIRWRADDLLWWTCPVVDHADYQRQVVNRTHLQKPLGCPVCEGKRPDKADSFGGQFPDLLKQWHPELNESISPFDITIGSMVEVWWRCPQDVTHEWIAPVFFRVRNSECPYCRLWFVTDENRLSIQFPEIASEWHPQKNRHLWPRMEGSYRAVANLRIPRHQKESNRRLRPADVAINSQEVFWWKCKLKGHVWQESVQARTEKGRGCPECAKLEFKNEKSLAAMYPSLAKLWHPTRNLSLTPHDVFPRSSKKMYWRCSRAGNHVWQAPVYRVVTSWKAGTNGCPWCSGLSVDDKNSLQSKFPLVAKLWHPTKNGQLTPASVTAKSNKKVWWHCGKPAHEFEAQVANMAASFEGGTNGCKFCRGNAVAPDNCLQSVCPEAAKLWHPTKNGMLTPRDVTRGSSKIVTWLCPKGHSWEAKVLSIVQSIDRKSAIMGCPQCMGKLPKRGKFS